MKVTRKSFLRMIKIMATAFVFQNMLSIPAMASKNDQKTQQDLVDELNEWYRTNKISIEIDNIDFSDEVNLENINVDMGVLKSIRVENQTSEILSSKGKPLINEIARIPMLISFTRSVDHSLAIHFEDGTEGCVHVEVQIDGVIDLQYDNVVSSHGVAYERNAINLDSIDIGTVSTYSDSPAKGDISYSVPCSARFAWTSPNTGLKYSGTANDTFEGTVSYY